MLVGCARSLRCLRPSPQIDAALARVAVDGLPAIGPLTTVALAPSGASVDNEAVVGAWPEPERARVLGDMPPGTQSVIAPRRKVLSLRSWQPVEQYDAGLLDALVPLRDALGTLASIEFLHLRPTSSAGPSPRLDLAVYAAETMPFDLLTRVLMVAQATGYQVFHLAVRDAGGAVRDLAILAPAFDIEALRVAKGAYCSVPIVTIGPRGFDFAVALGTVGDDVVAQPGAPDLRRIEAEKGFIRRYGEGGAPVAHLPPPRASAAAGAADLPQPGWARWYRRAVLRADRACPSVPLRGADLDVPGMLALVRDVHAIAPGCRSAYLRAQGDTPFVTLAPIAAALSRVAPRVVLLAPGPSREGLDCADAVPVSELAKAAR